MVTQGAVGNLARVNRHAARCGQDRKSWARPATRPSRFQHLPVKSEICLPVDGSLHFVLLPLRTSSAGASGAQAFEPCSQAARTCPKKSPSRGDDRSCREAPRCIKWLIGLGFPSDVQASYVIPKLNVVGSSPISRSSQAQQRRSVESNGLTGRQSFRDPFTPAFTLSATEVGTNRITPAVAARFSSSPTSE